MKNFILKIINILGLFKGDLVIVTLLLDFFDRGFTGDDCCFCLDFLFICRLGLS